MKRTIRGGKKALALLLTLLMLMSAVPMMAGAVVDRNDNKMKTADKYGTQPWNGTTDRWINFDVDRGYYVKLDYPSHIYLDKSETLQSVGYTIKVTWHYGDGGHASRLELSTATWGERLDAVEGLNNTGVNRNDTPEMYTMMDMFSSYTSDADIDPNNNSKSVYGTGVSWSDADLIIDDRDTWGSTKYPVTIFRCDQFATQADTNYIYLKGTPNSNYVGQTKAYCTKGPGAQGPMLWYGGIKWWNNGWKSEPQLFSFDGTYNGGRKCTSTSNYQVGANSRDEIGWDVTVYDKAALNTAINNAQTALTNTSSYSSYSNGTYAALQTAVTAAKAVLTTREVSQDDIDKQTTAVNNAYNNLSFSADKSALDTALANAKTYMDDSADYYEQPKYNNLKDAVDAANTFLKGTYKNFYYKDDMNAGSNAAGQVTTIKEHADKINGLMPVNLLTADFSKFYPHTPEFGTCYDAAAHKVFADLRVELNSMYNTWLNNQSGYTKKDHQADIDAKVTAYEAAYADLANHVQHQGPNEDVNVIPATCETDGRKDVKCKACGTVTQTGVEIPKTGHNFAPETVNGEVINAVSDGKGNHSYTCQNAKCDEKGTVDGGKGASVACTVEWEETENDTCEKDIVVSGKCKECSYREIKTIPALPHTWNDGVKTAPTCTTEGYTIKECTVCGATSGEIDKVAALGHKYDGAPVSVDGTHHAFGCSRCEADVHGIMGGDGKPVDNGSVECTFTESVPYKAPTCSAVGHNATEACVCGNTRGGEEIAIDENAHDWNEATYTWNNDHTACTAEAVCKLNPSHTVTETVDAVASEVVPATCTDKGSKTVTATFTKAPFDTQTKTNVEIAVDPNAHDLQDVAAQAATCTDKGWNAYKKCSRCDYKEGYQEIDALGHDFERTDWNAGAAEWTTVTDSTCTDLGIEKHVCVDCGNAETTRDIPTKDHDFTAERAEEKYLASEAKCDEKATFYKSCSVCGLSSKGTGNAATFESGDVLGHAFTKEVVDQAHLKSAANCQTEAVYYYNCSRCDAIATDDTENGTFKNGKKDAENHVLSTTHTVNDKTATCTEAGYTGDEAYDCCNAVKTTGTVISARGHEWQRDGWNAETADWTETLAATCKTEGTKTHKCSDCDEVKTETIPVNPDNHESEETYLDEESVTPATCQDKGFSGDWLHSCCGEIAVEGTETPINPENHAGGTEIRDAVKESCGKEGYSGDVYCLGCETMIEEGTAIPALKHEYKVVKTEGPTCQHGTITTYKCENCGDEYTVSDDSDKLNHVLSDDYKVMDEPTCSHNGTKAKYCIYCGEWDNKENWIAIDKLPHTVTSWDENYKPATCTNGGQKKGVCEVCGEEVIESTPAAGHNYGEWTVDPDNVPNCAHGGKKTSTCDRCGDVQIADIPATNCKPADEKIIPAVDPTCENPGHTEGKYCFTCGRIIVAPEEIPATGHKDADGDGVCDVCGKENIDCDCICHGNSVFGKIIRFFCTILSKIFRTRIACCDDMQWYGGDIGDIS